MTNLAATPALVIGENLFAAARVDLDGRGAVVDPTWTIRLGELHVAPVTWLDPGHLQLEIPRGLPAGTYDVVARSPRGEELVAPAALVVTDEPIGLSLSIEDAPGGAGQPISTTLVAGTSLEAFAVLRDAGGAFIADTVAAWTVSGAIGAVDAGPAASTRLRATTTGTGRIVAARPSAALTAETSDVHVIAGPPATLSIEDAPGGGGLPIGAVGGLTTDTTHGLSAFAIARDELGNFAGDVPATWSLDGAVASLPDLPTSAVILDFVTPGTAILRASTAAGTASTGALVIEPGRAAALAISPPTLALSADAPPVMFVATGVDADGNPTPDLGALAWSVAAGPIGALSSVGALDPAQAGTGTIAVTSSYGPRATSGAITITPGVAATLAVEPPSLTTDADAAPTVFVATGRDADGNATPALGTLAWSIGSGSISSLDGTGGFDPRTSGSGTVVVVSSLGLSASAPVSVAPGRAAALTITPSTVDVVQGGAPVAFTVTGTDTDGNATPDLGAITWTRDSGTFAELAPSGVLTPSTPGSGTIRATSSYGPARTSGPVRVRTPAALAATLTAPASALVGDTFTVHLTVVNTGESPATVEPCALARSGGGSVTSGPGSPTTATIGAGATIIFTWQLAATTAGSVGISTCASGNDTMLGAAIASNTAVATIEVRPPVTLTAILELPWLLGLDRTFAVTMRVTNTGTATATAVSPSTLAIAGTGGATLIAAPAGGLSIAPGATASFAWTYRSTALGTLVFSGNATGTDSVTSLAVSSPLAMSEERDVVETSLVAGDPFGDGTSFAYVVGYRGQVYLGPNKAGSRAIRLAPDGTLETLSFTFTRDNEGNRTTNNAATYTSIGATGCIANTAACGPDNENGRGQFAAGTLGGTEWLVLGGARPGGDLDYVYLTADSDTQLDFRFVDLSAFLGGSTRGFSAAHVHSGRLYLGFPDAGGSRPYFVALSSTPAAPGLDAGSGDAVDLTADRFPNWQSASPAMVDAIADHGGLLYAATSSGLMAATVAAPRDYKDFPGDWAVATPSAAAYTAKVSRTTSKLADLEPADRAFPQLASFGGRLFAARNTTVGPQLWSCDPALGAAPARCEPGDWQLIAANSLGDTQLTQFDNPALTTISMLVATSEALYVGFDSGGGVQVFRTSNPAALGRADFTGQLGCSAAHHPTTCAGVGGAGFGVSTDRRIFDAKAIAGSLWITTGDGSSALALVVIP